MNLFEELKRRNVIKAAISYLVLAFALLEAADIVFPIIGADPGAVRIILILATVFFPVWLVFAYIYEWTPNGFKKTDNVATADSVSHTTSKRLNRWIIGGLSLAIVLLVADRVFNVSGDLMQTQPETKTIAVLPFSHLSADAEDEFFTAGIHTDLLVKLASVHDFRLISKSSVMEFKDFEGDLSQVGQRLKARYILQGTVRRFQNQVRITVQLAESASSQVIWSDEYDEELKNVFELQSKIATQITGKLQANLSSSEKQGIEQRATTNLSAYDDYLKATYIINRPRPVYDDMKEATRLLDRAVAADPKFAKAWAALVQSNGELYRMLGFDAARIAEREQVKASVEKALKQAKSLSPDGWQVLREEAVYQLNIADDPLEALRLFDKAVERNPSDVYSMHQASLLYGQFGNVEKSLPLLEKAFELSPTTGPYSFFLSFAYEVYGKYDLLIEHLERLIELYPDDDTYPVELKYFQFLNNGKLSAFREFEQALNGTTVSTPWDERALKNKQMIVAMFNNRFETYHDQWAGRHDSHQRSHGNKICPMVANDFINHARMLKEQDHEEEALEIIGQIEGIPIMPVNLNTVCQFNSDTYLTKIELLTGDTLRAKELLEQTVLASIENKSIPIGAVEKTVTLQAADLIAPERIYYYYELLTKQAFSFTSFESICSDPWTYPNLIKDPQFVEEIKADGRFVEFLTHFGFLKSS